MQILKQILKTKRVQKWYQAQEKKIMKKLLLGLTLLASMTSFASDCTINIQNEIDDLELAKVQKTLKKKGYTTVESVSEADMQLKLEAYCSDATANLGCNRVYGYMTVSDNQSNEKLFLKKITDTSLFGRATKQSAVDSDIYRIPKCDKINLQ